MNEIAEKTIEAARPLATLGHLAPSSVEEFVVQFNSSHDFPRAVVTSTGDWETISLTLQFDGRELEECVYRGDFSTTVYKKIAENFWSQLNPSAHVECINIGTAAFGMGRDVAAGEIVVECEIEYDLQYL